MSLAPEVLAQVHDQIVHREVFDELAFQEIHDPHFLRQVLFEMLPHPDDVTPNPSAVIVKAANFTEKAFDGKSRKKGSRLGETIPDVVHAYRVAIRLSMAGFTDDETIITALLHDVIEDTPVKEEGKPIMANDIAAEFGDQIARNVFFLSRNFNKGADMPKEGYLSRMEKMGNEGLTVWRVKYADRIDNLWSFQRMDLTAEMKQGKTIRKIFKDDLEETDKDFRYLDPQNNYLKAKLAEVVTSGKKLLEREKIQIGRKGLRRKVS